MPPGGRAGDPPCGRGDPPGGRAGDPSGGRAGEPLGEPSSRPRKLRQGLTALGTLLLGLVVGLCSAALHQRWWGLLLAIAATGAAAYALPPGWWARMPFAVGWVAIVAYLAVPRDEGDYVIAGDLPGYVMLGFAVALVVAAAVTLQPLRRTDAANRPPPS